MPARAAERSRVSGSTLVVLQMGLFGLDDPEG